MLNDVFIVESAISAFNNAALVGPAFIWWTVLAIPLFVVAGWCKDAILARLKWNLENMLNNVALWTAGMTFVWVALFSGNYAVLRDNLSVLPMMVAVILFLTSLFVSSHLRKKPLPRMNMWRWLMVFAVLGCVGMSDLHAWWGPLLQIGAMMAGVLLGRIAKAEMRPIAGITLIVQMVVIAMMMQPEFFRFGQLGNLTGGHLAVMLVLGIVSAMCIAVLNINARGKIQDSVYIKIKWLMRVVSGLGAALFIITEAVPVFLGMLVAVFVSVALAVWHAKCIDVNFGYKMFAVQLFLFGAITVMPVISVMGVLYWCVLPETKVWQNIKRLL